MAGSSYTVNAGTRGLTIAGCPPASSQPIGDPANKEITMNDIKPLHNTDVGEPDRRRGLLGLLRQLGYAYIGSFSLAIEGAGALYQACVTRGEKTVNGIEAALAERRRYTSRRPLPQPSQEPSALILQKRLQTWLECDGRVTAADVAQLNERIDALTQQIDGMTQENNSA